MVNPFTPADEIDVDGLRSNVKYIISLGTNGLGFNWSAGEFWSLTNAEAKTVCETIVKEARGKVLTGCQIGRNSVKDSVMLAKHAEEVGVDLGILLPPTYVAKTDAQVYDYVKYIADRVDIGLAYTNWPPSGVILSPEGVARLAEIPNVCVVKEAHNNILQGIQTQKLVGDKVVVSVVNDEYYFYAPYHGVNQQVLFADPEDWLFDTPEKRPYREFLDLAAKGDIDKATAAFRRMLPFKRIYVDQWEYFAHKYNGMFPLPVFAKTWGALKGMAGGHARPPLPNMTRDERERLSHQLDGVGLAKKTPISA